jgi:hypothetical protein
LQEFLPGRKGINGFRQVCIGKIVFGNNPAQQGKDKPEIEIKHDFPGEATDL